MVDPKNNGENGDPGQVRADLLAHPLALPAIATTIGMGVASQMLGFWMGALSGTMQASRRIADEHAPLGGTAADVASLPVKEKPAIVRARKAVRKLIAEVHEPAVSEEKPAPAAIEKVMIVAATTFADDLKAISGVGPKLEQVLNRLGVSTYAQIATWTEAEIARIEEHFGFPGRVGRDGWVAQATKFLNERGRK